MNLLCLLELVLAKKGILYKSLFFVRHMVTLIWFLGIEIASRIKEICSFVSLIKEYTKTFPIR